MTTALASRLSLRPARTRTGWIGVDLGTSAVKLAQVERRDGAWRLAASLIVPTGEQRSPAALDDALRQQIRRAVRGGCSFRGSTAAAALPMSALDLRTLELPAGTDAELRQMIRQELDASGETISAENAAPHALETEFAFWRSASPPVQTPTVQCTVLSLPRSAANGVAEGLLHAGLRCAVLDALPFALARAVELAGATAGDRLKPVTPNEAAAALDWGHTSVVFTVAVDGRPRFTRTFRDCGLKHMHHAVAEGLSLSPPEAQHVLASCGLLDPERPSRISRIQAAVGELVSRPFRRVVDELRRTLAFLRQQSGTLPGVLWVCGGGSMVRNLPERLTAEIGIPALRWRLRGPDAAGPSDPAEGLFATAVALSALAEEAAA